MAEGVLEITQSSFETEVLKSDLPVLVDFWAGWCGPCKRIAPIVEALASENAGKVKFAKVDVDENSEVAARFGIMSIPALILFKDGEEADRLIGVHDQGTLQSFLDRHTG